ncbi:MAG: UDP-N-acetylmuramate dehydrogenase [Clostridia bacterium]|nr:UDP-N-acetylmuramate dehydrogenase [Clostridia bacterium]
MQDRFNAFCSALSGIKLQQNVPMAQYTSFRTGGPARVLAEPDSAKALCEAISLAKKFELPFVVIGNGSNLLVSDNGIEAVVFRIADSMAGICFDGLRVYLQSGVLLSTVAKRSVELGYAGLEWAAGIPGTVGGAVAMNAGAYGGEMKDVLTHVIWMDPQTGAITDSSVSKDDFSYRTSPFHAPERIVVAAELLLCRDEDGSAKEKMAEYTSKRREKQPLAWPSAGSTFKRPEGAFAGALIEQAGLKGYRIGGAEVSKLHAGFIINTGSATSADVYTLMQHVAKVVKDKSGYTLQPEVCFLGDFT